MQNEPSYIYRFYSIPIEEALYFASMLDVQERKDMCIFRPTTIMPLFQEAIDELNKIVKLTQEHPEYQAKHVKNSGIQPFSFDLFRSAVGLMLPTLSVVDMKFKLNPMSCTLPKLDSLYEYNRNYGTAEQAIRLKNLMPIYATEAVVNEEDAIIVEASLAVMLDMVSANKDRVEILGTSEELSTATTQYIQPAILKEVDAIYKRINLLAWSMQQELQVDLAGSIMPMAIKVRAKLWPSRYSTDVLRHYEPVIDDVSTSSNVEH